MHDIAKCVVLLFVGDVCFAEVCDLEYCLCHIFLLLFSYSILDVCCAVMRFVYAAVIHTLIAISAIIATG